MNLPQKFITLIRIFATLIFIIWGVTLWYLSSHPPKLQNQPEIPNLDKVLHFGYFGLGAILVGLSTKLMRIKSLKFWILLAALSLYGAFDEWHQTFTPGRSGNDPYDWTADFLGSFIGLIFVVILLNMLKWLAMKGTH